MTLVALALVLIPVTLFLYAYLGYPVFLMLAKKPAPKALRVYSHDPSVWPLITITLAAHNEEAAIARTIENVLALDYPADRRQILIVSDASTDSTDRIVETYADRGVELLRLNNRSGKTAAENAAVEHIRGDIVVNIDATTLIFPDALKNLSRVFQDPDIGVASCRDVSVGHTLVEQNRGESLYVRYEMWVRGLETRVGSIVGASGCLYAVRRSLLQHFTTSMSRDFAAALVAREEGLRAVAVEHVVCLVPRTPSLRMEFKRKTRTMAHGLETLWLKKSLLNPLRYGSFAVMLLSHKLARWLVPLTVPLGVLGLTLLAVKFGVARIALSGFLLVCALTMLALLWPENRRTPQLLGLLGFGGMSNLAGLMAWGNTLLGLKNEIWEPTRRPVVLERNEPLGGPVLGRTQVIDAPRQEGSA